MAGKTRREGKLTCGSALVLSWKYRRARQSVSLPVPEGAEVAPGGMEPAATRIEAQCRSIPSIT